MSDLFSPVQEGEENLRVNPILKFREAVGLEKFQRVPEPIIFFRVNQGKICSNRKKKIEH